MEDLAPGQPRLHAHPLVRLGQVRQEPAGEVLLPLEVEAVLDRRHAQRGGHRQPGALQSRVDNQVGAPEPSHPRGLPAVTADICPNVRSSNSCTSAPASAIRRPRSRMRRARSPGGPVATPKMASIAAAGAVSTTGRPAWIAAATLSAAVATSTSWPAARNAQASGTVGKRWPTPGEIAKSIRTAVG
ncbi:hypothetical protein Prum_063440 [Phytohabitans rumicis]|uniref:Uncharacterized protein n=1 Tax=Phytohabitans rumicis TaxID=1076125 RepID=A0A6V8L637_9ACTN|nr:hypothetical protein Prum_063440 [Phytohabitans rumicis]